MTNQERVLRHLNDHKTITSLEAITEYGNTRLSASIFELRRKGYDISTQTVEVLNRYGEKRHIAKYHLNTAFNGKAKGTLFGTITE